MRSDSLITLNDPKSFVSESYQMLCTNLNYVDVDSNEKVLLFSSATMEEGKTTSAVNTAITLANDGKKVLLMECDLRKARVHKLFQVEQSPGLTDYLAEKSGVTDLKDYIKSDVEVENLDILTAGQLPPSPPKVLGSKSMEELIKKCRKAYDVIIIDSPPVLSITDAAILSKLCDGIIMVVAVGTTKKEELVAARKAFERVNGKILGVVMTKVKMKNKSSYYYYYGQYK